MNIFKAFLVSAVLVMAGCSNSNNPSNTPSSEEIAKAEKEWNELDPLTKQIGCDLYSDMDASERASFDQVKISILEKDC